MKFRTFRLRWRVESKGTTAPEAMGSPTPEAAKGVIRPGAGLRLLASCFMFSPLAGLSCLASWHPSLLVVSFPALMLIFVAYAATITMRPGREMLTNNWQIYTARVDNIYDVNGYSFLDANDFLVRRGWFFLWTCSLVAAEGGYLFVCSNPFL